jgi:hypothetical protein
MTLWSNLWCKWSLSQNKGFFQNRGTDSKGLKTFKNILIGLSGRAVNFLIIMSIFTIAIVKIDINKK